jgi:hypothetical protein
MAATDETHTQTDGTARLPEGERRRGRPGAAVGPCGVAGTAVSCKKNKEFDWTVWWHRQKPTNQLVFANWPYYIDTTASGRRCS